MAHVCELTPRQRTVFDSIVAAAAAQNLIFLECGSGMGRTVILRAVAAATGAHYVSMASLVERLRRGHPAAVEEAFHDWLTELFESHARLAVDDLHLLYAVTEGCDYPRPGMADLAVTSILDQANATGRQLIFAVETDAPEAIARRGHRCQLADFESADYEHICRAHLGAEHSAHIDYGRLHRFAPSLNAWQLANACAAPGVVDTDSFIAHLTAHNLSSNVDIDEVRPVNWRDLKGMDAVIEALEAKIALPFEQHDLAVEMGLKPRRGVVLAGPPGTGKTTIGRALAHRLKGKFFLIDGTAVSASHRFYGRVDEIFNAAAVNAPAVLFIDDADLIFEAETGKDFCRYLLTKLDGLESASSDRVCVMITAMDVSSLPAALVRSGRIELWLETGLPGDHARAAILAECLDPLKPSVPDNIIQASRGLTGADLKSAAEDARLAAAYDRLRERPDRGLEQYLLDSVQAVWAKKRMYSRRRPAYWPGTRIGFGVEEPAMAARGAGSRT